MRGALPGHVAPLSHTQTHARSIRVIFEKQREKCVKPIMRRRDATHGVRSQCALADGDDGDRVPLITFVSSAAVNPGAPRTRHEPDRDASSTCPVWPVNSAGPK